MCAERVSGSYQLYNVISGKRFQLFPLLAQEGWREAPGWSLTHIPPRLFLDRSNSSVRMLGGMKFLIAIGLVAAMTQGKVQPQQSATPITSSDPFTREMDDKLGRILEIQNEKEMTNGPPKTVDRHENAMLVEIVNSSRN